jgi:glycosyltransferase involved in cell wall biosynthesis
MLKSIGVFRALDVRLNHAEFAASFRNFKPFFAANLTPEIKQYLTEKKVDYKDIQLKPRLVFDPIYPLLRKTDFTPWLAYDNEVLDEVVNNLDIMEIYEPYFFYSSQIADLAKKKSIPLVTEIWTSFATHPSVYVPPYSLLVKNVIRKTDLFVLRSEKALSYLERFTIPSSKKIVIYHGVNIKRFYPSKKHHEKIRILFVGALAPHKGLDDLLAVFPDLTHKYPNKLELIICGSGPLKKQIERMAETLPIAFHGQVSNLDLPEIYRSAAIYCQPSKDYIFMGVKGGEEFAGYTFMEALASGLPIVSTYCGGIPEIVGEDNALITQGSRRELFSELDKYIVNKTLRVETSLKNRERAEKLFDLSKQVSILEKTITMKLS